MIIFPAIDIKEGRVVRLVQGKFDQVTEYSQDPVAAARHWQGLGAQWLHLVDLDGALSGKTKNLDTILKIVKSVTIPVQMGGGLRTMEDIAAVLEGGVQRAILGTKVIEDRLFLKEVLKKWKERIAISLDCSKGMVAQRGWTTTSDLRAIDFVKDLEALGLKCLIYTDIEKDGMLSGPNYKELERILEITNIPVIASGGIASIEDIKKLKELEPKGVMGAITGKAIYEGKLDLKKALQIC